MNRERDRDAGESKAPLPASFGNDRYAVAKLLGEGAQAESFQAVDKKLGSLVVVKRFRVRGAKSWKEVELAEREAKVLASLRHPSLPRYVEHFEENGELFLVTEYIEGESLAKKRKRGDRSSEASVSRFLHTASDCLEYLHGLRPPIVHRDIKPSNVLQRPDGSFAIIDFGAVRDRLKPEGGSTVVGTFGYMAPEQFQGRAMPSSDVYAVGATALVLLTGLEPENLPHKGLGIDVEASVKGMNVSRWMVNALTQMVEPDPDRRASRIAPLLGSRSDSSQKSPSAQSREASSETDWPFRDVGRKSNKKEQRAERHEHKKEQRDARHAAQREQRNQRREERQRFRVRGYGRPLGLRGPPAWIIRLGLSIASAAVRFSLRVVVVPLLTMLSLVFGRVMKSAINDVIKAEGEAQDELRRARAYSVGSEEEVHAPAPSRVRVSAPPRNAPMNAKVSHDEFDEDLRAEAEAEAEEAATNAPRPTGRR